MRISYSFGIIDLLHYGHIKTLLAAKKSSDLHIFGLVSDEAAKDWLGTVVSNYEERKKVLENVSCIDEVVFQKTLDPLDNLINIHKKYPNAEITLYHGDNWKIMPSQEYLKSIGGDVVFTEYYEKLKPENILKILNNRDYKQRRNNNLISTKANTLLALKDKLKLSRIEDILVITVGEYEEDRASVFEKISNQFPGKKIVVRSSSSNEDSFENSNAGHYDSILNVDSNCESSVHDAINKVIKSYHRDSLHDKKEQVLIQTQTLNVELSGVIFTRDVNLNRPYYLINYDDDGSTDSVTSGVGGKTIWFSHDINLSDLHLRWRRLFEAIREIEELLQGMVLDIEFAINNLGEVIIFQVRPLAANYKFKQETNDNDFFAMKEVEKNRYHRTIINEYENKPMMLSDMAFWNPSEIIGSNPRNLDYSLYREIITKRAWNEGLVPMGYTEVNNDLMYKLGNKPYISLEYSFMSLIPGDLDENIRLKLMKFYKDKLTKDLTAHDKIEFEIAVSCYDLDTTLKLSELKNNNFSMEDIQSIQTSLFNLTQRALKDYYVTLDKDLDDLKTLEMKRSRIVESLPFKENNLHDLLSYFRNTISDLKKYGTPQFSRQARYAFISRTICQSLVNQGYLDQEDLDQFLLSIETVASNFERDFNLYLAKKMTREEFNKGYGHLRSGTYDIRTPRYDQINFDSIEGNIDVVDGKANKDKINYQTFINAVEKLQFGIEPAELINILKNSLEQREYFKFEFTKSLSLALEILILIGKKINIDKSLLSYLEMSDILAAEYYDSESNLREFWTTIITQRKIIYKERSKLVLPEVITSEQDFDFIEYGESRPNFITNKLVDGEIVLLEEDSNADIAGKIVVISKADPGFDWIFARDIKGLITKYGGVASHMAIRCAEFGVPAAIGCGEKIYQYVTQLQNIILDCKMGRISERR